ncbi:hypothetical protein GGR52DRAFT_568336 [Hypoxylon sp. FL1284]|nr:hypothetical protein GGR52DRAFT_568336 [Hypoxylon sp. FL1284]
MPPKRTATGSGASASKRAKATATATNDDPPRRKRWSAVSGSANADADYQTTWKNPDKWYSFVTICSPLRNEEDDDDEDDEGSEDEDDQGGDTCGKQGCLCLKPVEENPEHPWVVSRAGYRKYSTQPYGGIEVVQNLFLDYVEDAERGWREQWAICEGLGLFLLSPVSSALTMVDDGDYAEETMRLVGRMFLNMFAQLDAQKLVGDASDVKSLGTIMAMYLAIAADMRLSSILKHDGKKGTKKFEPERFDDAVLSYANKRGVTLQGPRDIDELTAALNGNVDLPKEGAKDPWGWEAGLAKYKKRYAGRTNAMVKRKSPDIGGDALDITTWTSAERKAASFNKKDPLGKREIDAIKKGMVMQRA